MASECVRVITRCRPFNTRETQLNSKNVVEMDTTMFQCSLQTANDEPPKTFTFDGVYDQQSTTEQIYMDTVYPLVEGVIEGYNATVFAYGQTGSGKSFTMQGVPSPTSQNGIIPRVFEHIFETMSVSDGTKYLCSASYLEIYNEELRDLLNLGSKLKLELKENSDKVVYVSQLSQHLVQSVADCQTLMETGWKNRSVGATLMNADSSRSHSIFSISVEMMSLNEGAHEQTIKRGKLNLVDLAGSERQAKTGATGSRLKEATKINLSLSALGNVISALVDGKCCHIPYRDSKLTRLLQDSLGGNTKTLMIACISPADDNYDETLSTLRYANRAKNIKNKPKINQDPKDAMLKEYQMEIERLRQLVDNQGLVHTSATDDRVMDEEKNQLQKDYEDKISQLQRDIEKEQESNAKAAAEMENLRQFYQDELLKIDSSSASSDREKVVDDQGDTQEILKKLKDIEANLVGGEMVHDRQIQERYKKKKNQWEERRKLVAQVLTKADDEDGVLLRVYDDIQDEVRIKSEFIKKYKQKVRMLGQEIQDLQSEFETERVDYLETIRRQDRQLKLLNQILTKIQPLIRKDSNYGDLESTMRNCLWMDETQRWKLPEVTFLRTKLPPAGLQSVQHNLHESPMETNEYAVADRLFHKLQRGEEENLAGHYFTSNRASKILSQVHNDVHRATRMAINKKESKLSQSHNSLNVDSRNHLTDHLVTPPPAQGSWSAPNYASSHLWTKNRGLINGATVKLRPSSRLESLSTHMVTKDVLRTPSIPVNQSQMHFIDLE